MYHIERFALGALSIALCGVIWFAVTEAPIQALIGASSIAIAYFVGYFIEAVMEDNKRGSNK